MKTRTVKLCLVCSYVRDEHGRCKCAGPGKEPKPSSEYRDEQERGNICIKCGHVDVCAMVNAIGAVEDRSKLLHFIIISQCANFLGEV